MNTLCIRYCRWMIRRDLPQVMEIERTCEQAWKEERMVAMMSTTDTIGMVAELFDDTIAGYFIYTFHKDHIELRKLAVAPRFRGQGVGRAILRRLIAKLSSTHRKTLRVYVRESDLDAHLFFRSLGVRAVGVERAFFEDTMEDAYVFEHTSTEEAPPDECGR